jgi:hypothetical protein
MNNESIDPTKVKFIYATAFTGQNVKIALPGFENNEYIKQQLLQAGVPMDKLKYTSFSLNPPVPASQLINSFPSRHEIESDPSPFPPYPKPATKSSFPSMWSTLKVRKYTSLIDLKTAGGHFCMKRQDRVNMDLLSLPQSWFLNPDDWNDLVNGNIGLLYGVAWNQVNTQAIGEGVKYNQSLILTSGMSETTQYSISVTLGASGFGLSASLTATFGQTFEVNSSKTYTEGFTVDFVTGKVLILGIWQLNDLFYLVKKDANGKYVFIDSYHLQMKDQSKNGQNFTLDADSNFFGCADLMDDGKKIGTSLAQPTARVAQDVTPFNA